MNNIVYEILRSIVVFTFIGITNNIIFKKSRNTKRCAVTAQLPKGVILKMPADPGGPSLLLARAASGAASRPQHKEVAMKKRKIRMI